MMFFQAGTAAWLSSLVPGDNPRGAGALDGTFPLRAGGSPTSSRGREAVPAPQDPLWMSLLGRCLCSRPRQDLLLQGFGEPNCSPAAVLGSGRLMETFTPSGSSPSWSCLSTNASCSPHACSSSTYRRLVSASQRGTARGTWGLMPNQTHWMCSGRTSVSPGELWQVPTPPRGWGFRGPHGACSSASHAKPAGLRITYCRDPKITGTVSHTSWGLGDAQLLSSGKLIWGLSLDMDYKYHG